MKIPPLIFILFGLIVTSCHFNQQSAVSQNGRVDSTSIKSFTTDSNLNATIDSIKIDSNLINKLKTHLKTYTLYSGADILPRPTHWSDETSFFGVYQFSDSVTGIGLDLNDDTHTYYANLFNSVKVDFPACPSLTTLLHNDTIKDLFFKNDTTRYFYVYCTKGLTTAKIKDVYFNGGPCCGFIAIQLSHIDTVKYGHPVIASKRKINLTYSVNKEFQHDLNVVDSMDEFQSYFRGPDTTYTKQTVNSKEVQIPLSVQFASNDTLFFTYTDNFQPWGDDTEYRSRTVFKHGRKLAVIWWSGGIVSMASECD